jgi:hypothetical protein
LCCGRGDRGIRERDERSTSWNALREVEGVVYIGLEYSRWNRAVGKVTVEKEPLKK